MNNSGPVVLDFKKHGVKITVEGENCNYWSGIFMDALISSKSEKAKERAEYNDSVIKLTQELIDSNSYPFIKAVLRYRLAAILMSNIIKDGVPNQIYQEKATSEIRLADSELQTHDEKIGQILENQTIF